MDKQGVIDYVMKSPQNTNPAVLSSILDDISGGDSEYTLNVFNVKVTNLSKTTSLVLEVPYIYESGTHEFYSKGTTNGISINGSVNLKVIAVNGEAQITDGYVMSHEYVAVTNPENFSYKNGYYKILGDCEINVNAKS